MKRIDWLSGRAERVMAPDTAAVTSFGEASEVSPRCDLESREQASTPEPVGGPMTMRDRLLGRIPASLRRASTDMDDGERERILASRIQYGAWMLVLFPIFRITAGRVIGDLELLLVAHAAVLTTLLCVALTQSWPRRAPLAFTSAIVGATTALHVVEVVVTGESSWLLLSAACLPVVVSVALPWPLGHQLTVVAITALGVLFGAAIVPASITTLGPAAVLVGGVASLLVTHVREGSRFRREAAVEARLQRQIVLRELQGKLERSACDAALAGLLEPQAAETARVFHAQLTDAQAEAEAELSRLRAALEAAVDRCDRERDTRARTEASLAEYERALSWATLVADGVARQNAEHVEQADRQRAELDELRRGERELAAAAKHLSEAKGTAEAQARDLALLLDQAHEQAARAADEGVRLHRALEDRECESEKVAAELSATHARYAAEMDALRAALDRETGACRASRDTLQNTEQRLQHAEAECERLAADLVQARAVAAAEAGKREIAERELASTRDALQDERSAAAERGREWSQRLAALETRLASEQKAQQQLRDEIDVAERSWSATEQARAHSLSRLAAELDLARSAVVEEARKRDCVESALAEAERRLESSKEKAEARIREATAELVNARANLQRERDARSAAEAAASRATAESLRQRAWAERRVAELEEQWATAGQHQSDELAAELVTARATMERRLEADQHALAAANATAARHLERVRELEAELGRRDLPMAELTEELQEVRSAFEAEVHRLNGALEREGEARARAQAEAEGAQLRVHERDREIERLGGDLATETEANQSLAGKLQQVRARLSAAEEGLRERDALLQSQGEELLRSREAVDQARRGADAKVTSMGQSLHVAESELQVARRRCEELEKEISQQAASACEATRVATASGEQWRSRFEASQQAREDEGRRRREAEERLQAVRAEAEVDLPTTRHQLEALRAELRQAKESMAREVRQREAAVGTLRMYRNQMQLRHGWISEMVDHVRPLLARVRSCVDEIAASEKDGERGRMLAAARIETWCVARTIDDLLDIEAIQSRGRRVPRESAAISEVLVETLAMLANDGDTMWKLDAEPRLPEVCIETGHLFQLLGNLLAFAATNAKKGGPLRVSARQCSGEVVVAVRAPGVVAGDDADQMFGRFSTTADGSGLQPVLTKTIAEAFGGRVWAESHGDGTGTLAVALPAFHAENVLGPVAVQRRAGASHA